MVLKNIIVFFTFNLTSHQIFYLPPKRIPLSSMSARPIGGGIFLKHPWWTRLCLSRQSLCTTHRLPMSTYWILGGFRKTDTCWAVWNRFLRYWGSSDERFRKNADKSSIPILYDDSFTIGSGRHVAFEMHVVKTTIIRCYTYTYDWCLAAGLSDEIERSRRDRRDISIVNRNQRF